MESGFSYTGVRGAEEPGGCWDPSIGDRVWPSRRKHLMVQSWCSVQRAHPSWSTRITRGAAACRRAFPSTVCSWHFIKRCMEHPVPLEIEEWVEKKSFGVLTGNEVPDEDGFYTLGRNVTSGCHLPWAVAMGICPCLLNPCFLWDPLAVDNPGMSPQGGAKAAGSPRNSRFVFPLPEDALGESLQFALGFSAVRRARGAFGEGIHGWQPAALPSAPSPQPQEREGTGMKCCKTLFVRGGAEIFMHSVYIPSGLALALCFKISW